MRGREVSVDTHDRPPARALPLPSPASGLTHEVSTPTGLHSIPLTTVRYLFAGTRCHLPDSHWLPAGFGVELRTAPPAFQPA